MAPTVTPETPISREDVLKILNRHFTPDARGQLLKLLRFWRLVAGITILLAIGGYGGLLVLAMRPGLIPYPIVYDPDGSIIWHGPAQTTREDRMVDVGLMEIVRWMREAPDDQTVLHADREQALAHVTGKAAVKFIPYNQQSIKDYLNPQTRVLVSIDRHRMTVTRKGAKQVWIGWHEVRTPKYGYSADTRQFEAVIDYDWFAQPEGWTVAQAKKNPRRLFVTDYTWDEVRQGAR